MPEPFKELEDEEPDLACVGKLRPQLKELTSFKPKLLIRFIMRKPC